LDSLRPYNDVSGIRSLKINFAYDGELYMLSLICGDKIMNYFRYLANGNSGTY